MYMYNVHKIMMSILYYISIEMHWYMCYNETIESIDNGEIQVKANVQGVTPQMFQKWGGDHRNPTARIPIQQRIRSCIGSAFF